MALGLNALHTPCQPALSSRSAVVTQGAARGWEGPVGHRQHRLGSGLQPHRPYEPLVRLGVSGVAVPEPHTELPELRPEHNSQDIGHMQRAYAQAWMGYQRSEIPIGAVVVHDGRVVGEAHNNALETNDPTSHAEMRAIKQAATAIGNWRYLRDATLFVTVEPCVMCAGAILQSRVGRLVYGAPNYLLGGDGSWVQLFNIPRRTDGEEMDAVVGDVPSALTAHPYQPQVEIVRGVMETECKDLMQRFFRERRKNKLKFLPFEEARELVREVGLEGKEQWVEWCKDAARPADVPSHPHRTYKDTGWVSWADWLGYGGEERMRL